LGVVVVELPCPQAASKMSKSASREKTAVFIRIFVFLDERVRFGDIGNLLAKNRSGTGLKIGVVTEPKFPVA
jgi:hypothetical protein